jgi:hypothetical protein
MAAWQNQFMFDGVQPPFREPAPDISFNPDSHRDVATLAAG